MIPGVALTAGLALAGVSAVPATAASPVARAAGICRAPGPVPGANIHSLITKNMNCTAARHDTERYIENRTEPHGFTCSVTHHGSREVELVCHRGDRSFQAAWRVTSA